MKLRIDPAVISMFRGRRNGFPKDGVEALIGGPTHLDYLEALDVEAPGLVSATARMSKDGRRFVLQFRADYNGNTYGIEAPIDLGLHPSTGAFAVDLKATVQSALGRLVISRVSARFNKGEGT